MEKINRQDILIDDLISRVNIGVPCDMPTNDESKKTIVIFLCPFNKQCEILNTKICTKH